ncbi:unnamed protein product [Schistosoma mattheei]|uniref:BPL/LPL catalytic domain-containing protein n=1 Tax=Schistosoma mattheei TaxID=31246 RepID=A0A3P8HP76_9TREM|nr:unnamed protein product [Schistosoma mattheei]
MITYHGPGQLVAYPIINLRCKSLQGRGLRWYVGALEEAGIKLCSQFGVTTFAGKDSETGVWFDSRHKVMAIGKLFFLSCNHIIVLVINHRRLRTFSI